MTLILRSLNCGALRPSGCQHDFSRSVSTDHAHRWEMSASSVVHTGVKSPGCEKNMTWANDTSLSTRAQPEPAPEGVPKRCRSTRET